MRICQGIWDGDPPECRGHCRGWSWNNPRATPPRCGWQSLRPLRPWSCRALRPQDGAGRVRPCHQYTCPVVFGQVPAPQGLQWRRHHSQTAVYRPEGRWAFAGCSCWCCLAGSMAGRRGGGKRQDARTIKPPAIKQAASWREGMCGARMEGQMNPRTPRDHMGM